MVETRPDVVLAGVGATTAALVQATRTIPIVFAQGIDPVGAGYFDSVARPGGNVTGFVQLDYSLAGKWTELLKEIAPEVTRVAARASIPVLPRRRPATKHRHALTALSA